MSDIMKKIGYLIFNFFYYIFYFLSYLLPKKNKIFLIMTHDESPEANVLYTANYFKLKDPNLEIKKLTKKDSDFKGEKIVILKIIKFFIVNPYHIASSKIILMDNIFLAFAYTIFKKNVSVVQLWHGTGTIKKFALDSEKDPIRKLAKKASMRNTHLIIGSDSMFQIYKSAFGMANEKIFPIGTPRTDLFFDKKFIKFKVDTFYKKYPELLNKKIILYAPTFRDEELNNFKKYYNNKKENNLYINNEIIEIIKKLNNDYVLGLRLHPAISKSFSIEKLKIDESMNKRIYDFSDNRGDITLNSLLFVSELLITDYSSIIFEYSLLNKKIIFYPYDLEEYEKKSRGFYFDYGKFVPGSIIKNAEDIPKEILKNNTNIENSCIIKNFKKKYMDKIDGNSTKRLYEILYK